MTQLSAIDRGIIVSRYITGAPSECEQLALRYPEIITASVRASRAAWLADTV